MSVELKRENRDELISESLANEREKRDELNLEIMANNAALSTAEEEDAKMQKINNLLKMIEAQVSTFLFLDRLNIKGAFTVRSQARCGYGSKPFPFHFSDVFSNPSQ